MGQAVTATSPSGGAFGADGAIRRRQRQAENFPVALRLLPRHLRADLLAIYALARLIDDVGDDPDATSGERLVQLEAIDADLRRLAVGVAQTPAVAALAPQVEVDRDVVAPFLDLVAANVADQSVRRYPTYADLLGYCALSANPIGRLVLTVFDVDRDAVGGWSDDVCTALQILEHCQDVAEDKRTHDRVYLPQEDLARFGVGDADLDATRTSPELRAVVALEVDRAEALLDSGRRLVRALHGWARVAVAGYVAGGLATADALRRAEHDVLAVTPRPARRDVARHVAGLVVTR